MCFFATTPQQPQKEGTIGVGLSQQNLQQKQQQQPNNLLTETVEPGSTAQGPNPAPAGQVARTDKKEKKIKKRKTLCFMS